MSINSLIFNILERYITYFYEKSQFLTYKEVSIIYLKINNIEYMAVDDEKNYYGTSKFYKIYDPNTGVFSGIYNDKTNKIQYDDETSYIDVHSNINKLDRFKLIYEFSKCNAEFITNKFYERYYHYDDRNREHRILNKIIIELFESNEDNYNELCYRLFYNNKYDIHYNQVDSSPIEEKINNQDYDNFKNTFYINELHGESKNIQIVMDYINTMIYDNNIQEYINKIIFYCSHSISTLK